MNRFTGFYTAIITPFDENDTVDEKGLRENIRNQIREGVDGIVVLGTTGETPTLTPEEKKLIQNITFEETTGKIPMIVGTGSYSTKQTIKNTLEAQKLGASAALIVTPYYNKPTQEGIYRHFLAVADSITIPIIIYNIGGRTGQNIQTETIKRLAAIPNIVGVKEASGNINQIAEVIELVARKNPDFTVLSGDDALTFPLMALGGHGVMSVLGNLIPGKIKELINALENEDYKNAREIHYKLMPLFRAAFIETNPVPIKTAMNYFEMPAGKVRLPLYELSPENESELICVLDQYEFLFHENGVAP
jgi:4-hydroxy-tetrahydrodipicolinate synthase